MLCGGASSRMGSDKALLQWHGVPMAARVAAALRAAGCEPVVAIGGDAAALGALDLEVVPDEWPGEGPLGGVITALRHFAGRAVVVVSCDLPLLTAGTVHAILGALGGAQAAMPRTDRLQPLCAAWSPAALPMLEVGFSQGERSIRAAIGGLVVAHPAVDRQDLTNVNAPRDLHQ